jgi:NADH:ubiquinone oxidoreductase subunit F (NADH-binding)/NADH:ubiquinone oxidoreductase subunit E
MEDNDKTIKIRPMSRTLTETSTPAVLASAEDMRQTLRRISHLKGRQASAEAMAWVQQHIGEGPYRRDLLIEYLHRLNDAAGCLREAHLVALAKCLQLSMVEVFEVASFYHHFEVVADDAAVPHVTVRVCDSMSCEMGGARALLDKLPAMLGDKVLVVPVPCVGRCEQAPVAVVHHNPVTYATPERVVQAVKAKHFAASDSAQTPTYVDFERYRAEGGYTLVQQIAKRQRDAETVLQTLEQSGLRGLGGAGFPAGRKWRIVRGMAAPRLLAVNIDEGEPGTFKDRTYLESDPHRFLEGLLIACQVVGIDAVYIYLRDEYHACRELLQAELQKLQANPPLDLPRIELRRGAGAYVCGEESAMIESIEGKRGEPRLRPPYIAEVGLFGRPTLEHNFETLHWVRDIVEKGATWFTQHGRHGRQGLRSFSVSGRVRAPGVKLAPAGITLRELVDEYCGGMADGHTLYGYFPGGASGGILPASLADVPLDFDTLQPHGCFIGSAAVVVFSQHDRARDLALNAMRFFAHESCGQCTPCRVGTDKAAQLMQAPQWDHATLEDLSRVMIDASICGLGQAAPNPVRCVQQYFSHEVA